MTEFNKDNYTDIATSRMIQVDDGEVKKARRN